MKRTVTTITNYVRKLCIYSHVLECSNSGEEIEETRIHILGKFHILILRRPQNFVKSPP